MFRNPVSVPSSKAGCRQYPKEYIQYSNHGESLKSRKYTIRHNTSTLYNNVLHISVHYEHHQTPLLQKLKYIIILHSSTLCFKFLYVLTMWTWLTITILFRFIPLCLLYLKYKWSIQSNATLQCYKTMCYLYWFIRTIIRHLYYRSVVIKVIQVPKDSSDEPKHVAHCCIVLKCCVWLHSKHSVMNFNKNVKHSVWKTSQSQYGVNWWHVLFLPLICE